MIYIIYIIAFLLVFIMFYIIFGGMYASYLIDNGFYTSQELDEFPTYLTSKEEYNCILKKLIFFVSQTLENKMSSLSVTSDNINCLVCKGLTPVKPYSLMIGRGLLFYYFEGNILFEIQMSYGGTSRIYSTKNKILFILKYTCPYSERIFNEPEICVMQDFIYPTPPSGRLEEWIRKKESEVVPIGRIYRSPIIRNLFNSDLDFSEEEIVNALKKVTSVEIVDNQLVFYSNQVKPVL
jgi:hypothetical protein